MPVPTSEKQGGGPGRAHAEAILELERSSRMAPHLPHEYYVFDEQDYAPYDHDDVRPAHIAPAEETTVCACTRTQNTGEATLRGASGTLLHRLDMHSEKSLPAGTLGRTGPDLISAASRTLRPRNIETRKILDSEKLVAKMVSGSDVIAYFAGTPDKAVVKLVFCAPTTMPVDKVYDPYTLRVIDGDIAKKLPVYYTIAQNGVMRIVNQNVKSLRFYDLINGKNTIDPSSARDPTRDNQDQDFDIVGGGAVLQSATQPIFGESQGVHDERALDLSARLRRRKHFESTDPRILSDTIEADLVSAIHDDASEFVLLDRWILEASNFGILRNYTFFRHFYTVKALRQWIAFRKFGRYSRHRKMLTMGLFAARPHFLKTLSAISLILYDVRTLSAIDFYCKTNETAQKAAPTSPQASGKKENEEQHLLLTCAAQPLPAWRSAQIQIKRSTSEALDAASDGILDEVTALCAELRRRATDDDELEQAKVPLFMKQKLARTKAITVTKLEQLERQKAIRQAQDELLTIANFVKLCDYLCNEALLELVYSSTKALEDAIVSPPVERVGLVVSEIFFRPVPEGLRFEETDATGDVEFRPPLREIQTTILESITEVVSLCAQQTHLSQLASLREYFLLAGQPLPSTQSIIAIAAGDAALQTSITAIECATSDQIAKLEAFSKGYSQLYPIHAFLSTWDEEAYTARYLSALSCDPHVLLPDTLVAPISGKTIADIRSYLTTPPNLQNLPAEDRQVLEETYEHARSIYSTRPLERQIALFRQWSQMLSRMAANSSTGFAQLDARTLLQTLQPVPIMGLKAVENTALKILRNLVSACTSAFRTHLKVLSIEPRSLTEFCSYVKYVHSVDSEMEHFVSEVQLADDLIVMLASSNILQIAPPTNMFVIFDPQVSADDLLTSDTKLNPPVSGLGCRVSVADRTSVDTLHSDLQQLQARRAFAEQLIREQHYTMSSALKESLTSTINDAADIRLTLLSGSACDSNAEPRSVVAHIDELSSNLNEIAQKYKELVGESDVLVGWYTKDDPAAIGGDGKQSLKVLPGQTPTPSQLVCASNLENLNSLKDTIAQIRQDLELRSRLWKRMLEWRVFEDRIVVSSWVDTVVNSSADSETDGATPPTPEPTAPESEEPTDAPPLDSQEEEAAPVDPVVERFKHITAESSVNFINEVAKDANKFSRQLPDDSVANALKRAVTSMKQKSQLIQDLGNPHMKQRHWEKVFELLRPTAKDPSLLSYNSGFSLETLLDAGIIAKRSEVSTISVTATGERNIELSLGKIQGTWEGTMLALKEYPSRTGNTYYIISGVEELYQQLEDSTATLQAMAGSRFVAGIKSLIDAWDKRLSNFSEVLDEWCKLQQTWLYLESIFAPEDIRRQLPQESTDFMQIDSYWVTLMGTIHANPCVMTVINAGQPGTPLQDHDILREFTDANARLEIIQKRLEDYLESKRLAFPRFFFLSNDELLQILAQTTDANAVRPFLRKIFEAIGDIDISTPAPVVAPTFPTSSERDGASTGDGTRSSKDRRKRRSEAGEPPQTSPLLTAMISPEGERVDFITPVVPTGGLVEVWLTALEKEMVHTVRERMYHTLCTAPKEGESRRDWMFSHPAQCIMACGQAVWSAGVEEGLCKDEQSGDTQRGSMNAFAQSLMRQIEELVALTVSNLDSRQRGLISTLIVLEVHSRDVAASLLDPNSDSFCSSMYDFGWLKQLRYYWQLDAEKAAGPETASSRPTSSGSVPREQRGVQEVKGNLIIRQTNSMFTCGYEYMGISTRLVMTPLTDRCFITLTSALANFMGGAPQGPAGTGKTESTKDLAKAMCIQCLVFNCSEGLNVAAMGKFFIGLVMCGAWSCFDEFNRIEVEVLSVVAQQILCIQTAILRGVDRFLFNAGTSSDAGLEISVGNGDPSKKCGIFITMNPGYAGRVELPDNLKALFRPISMVVPDYSLIAEIILFSEGFTTAKVLSKKMVQLYKLSSEQLSHQSHYDFGMRAIKSVLVMAGGLRRKYEHLSEDVVLIRAMRDANLPKFLIDDIELFMGIVQDLFPGVQIPSVEHGELYEQITQILRNDGLQPSAEYTKKVIQIYDTHVIRHGLMTVGDTLTGKTVARDVLAQAITNIAGGIAESGGQSDEFCPVVQYVINSKAVTMPELYGEFNAVSHDWTDGLIAVTARKVIDPQNAHQKHWICFDSPVDALWIENLNTTLDDNKMICLANGERIRLHSKVNLFFEVADLSQASPATVSRCGMIYFASEFIGHENLFRSLLVDNQKCLLGKLLDLVCLEEFSLSLQELRGEAQILASSELRAGDEDEQNSGAASDLLQTTMASLPEPVGPQLAVSTYPPPLAKFQAFEAVLHKSVQVLATRVYTQLCYIYSKLIPYLRDNCREEMRTVDFQLAMSAYQLLESLIGERLAFAREKVAELTIQRRIQEQQRVSSRQKGRGGTDDVPVAERTALEVFLDKLPSLEIIANRANTGMAPVVSILLDQRVLFAVAWGLAGSACAEFRPKIDAFLRATLSSSGLSVPELSALSNAFPPATTSTGHPATIYDWRLDNQTRGYAVWDSGSLQTLFGQKRFDGSILKQGGSVFDMIIPTADFIRLCAVTQSLLRNGNNIFLCGATGTSKTSVVKTIFTRCIGNAELAKKGGDEKKAEEPREDEEVGGAAASNTAATVDETNYGLETALLNANTLEFPMSAQTRASAVEEAIVEKMDRKRKTLFCPANQRKAMFVFIDDATMPTPDTYGSQPPIEILRQIISEGGCYDRQKLQFRTLEGLQFLCASLPPGGGRNAVSRRFSGKFAVLACEEIAHQALITIFGNLLQGFITSDVEGKAFSLDIRKGLRQCVNFVVQLYENTRVDIRATPLKSHYSFNVRDIAKVIGGVFAVTPDEVPRLPDLAALLIHESYRVFRDRLVDAKDCETFDRVLITTAWRHFGKTVEAAEKGTSEGGETSAESRDEYVEIDFDQPEQASDGAQDGGQASDEQDAKGSLRSAEELAALRDRLTSWIGYPIACRDLLFGRWANSAGTIGDGVACPYRNLHGQDTDIKNCLTYYVDSVADAQEAEPPGSAGGKVDFAELMERAEKSDDSESVRLVMFQDAVLHFSRLFRILTQPQGHMLMIGLSGSGRRSLVRLAAFAVGARVIYPSASKLYGVNEFYEDLKRCMLASGCDNVPTILLLSESQLDANDTFLEILNGVLNGVTLPANLWKPDERERIMQRTLELLAAAEDEEDAGTKRAYLPHELWQLFYRTVRCNLHICLCLSPIGDALRRRLRMFPALNSCMTIDWFSAWQADALVAVALHEIAGIHPAFFSGEGIGGSESREDLGALTRKIAEACVRVHTIVESTSESYFQRTKTRIYVTPPLYLSFIRLFKVILAKSVGKMRLRQEILQSGLTKLTSTREQVSGMQQTLTDLQPVLAESIANTEQLLGNLSKETEEVNKVRAVVQVEEQEVAKIAAEAAEIKDDAQRDLDLALPAFNAAINSLKALNKNDISELKSFKSPPELVRYVMEAVCILLEMPKQDWETAQKLLGRTDFLQTLMNLDKDNIKAKTLRMLRKYTQNPDFDPAKVEKVSKAARSLCMWCKAIDIYAKVFAEIEPKREKLAKAEQVLAEQEAALSVKQKALAEIEAKLAGLQASYDESMAKRAKLEADIEETRVRLERAEKLITGLAGEYDAWSLGIKNISERLHTAIGDALLGAGFIAYLGSFSADERGGILNSWQSALGGIPFSDGFTLSDYPAVADPRQIRHWKENCTLPADQGSIESAIIALQATRFPLLIDPELQGVRFIRKLEEKKGLQLASGAALDTMMRTLENAIRLGSPVLVENLQDEVDGSIMSVLRRELVKKGGQYTIKLGDNEIEYNADFKLYLATRKRQPNYSPDVQSAASIVNMAVSSRGLEEQLLSLVVLVENESLEKAKDRVASQLADGQETLTQLQDKLLDMLANAQGNLLDDENLIEALQTSKATQKQIDEQVVSARQTALRVDALRERFRPVAIRGRILYEVIASLATLDAMYVYSLDFFKALFAKTLRKLRESNPMPASEEQDVGDEAQEEDPAAEQRLKLKVMTMVSAITEAAYGAICRGIFERHKRIFSFMIATSIQRTEGAISADEWNIFRATYLDERIPRVPDSFYVHLTDTLGYNPPATPFANIACLHDVLQCCLTHEEFMLSTREHQDEWKAFLSSDSLEGVLSRPKDTERDGASSFGPHVLTFIKTCSPFQRILLLKAINPNRLMFFLPFYIQDVLGDYYVDPPRFAFEQAYADTGFATPTVFILSAGTDPHAQLVSFAREKGMADNLHTLSLGQGQGAIAETLLGRSVLDGSWVCLQNCHLCLSWMTNLARFVEDLATMEADNCDSTGATINHRFRLFLTSMPSPRFPQSVLSSSIKISHEPPRGLKANVLLCYSNMQEEFHDVIEEQPLCSNHWHRLIFGVSFFYASLLERKRFGSVAYNNPYEFSIPDLEISRRFIRQYLIDNVEDLGLDTENPERPSSSSFLQKITDAVPYQTLQYMVGVIAFGGRVTDALDQRCITAILSYIINPQLFSDTPELFMEGNVARAERPYATPNPRLGLTSVIEWLSRDFPADAPPGLFGLHLNAELNYQKAEAKLILDSVLSMSPKDSSQAQEESQDSSRPPQEGNEEEESLSTTDREVLRISSELYKQIPPNLNLQSIRMPSHIHVLSNGEQIKMPSPLYAVLKQECERYNKLLAVARVAFRDVGRAIKGLAVMSVSLEDVYACALSNRLPAMLVEACYPTLKSLSAWIKDLVDRVEFIRAWVELRRTTGIDYHDSDFRWQIKGHIPRTFWMGAFFFPHGLLTALLQHHSRIEGLSIDTLAFQTDVLDETTVSKITSDTENVDGLVITGLFVESARWDSEANCLTEPIYGQIVTPLGPVWFQPKTAVDRTGTYATPLYTTMLRYGVLSTTGTSTNYVLNMHLPTKQDPKHWILRGAAAFIQRSD
ncbi:IAD-5 dynein heavy chain [Giardia muris]|uniref:IAD-5 dynein heavy chain n=1 Tax=Giardia muris TaxID=5742 RepID=A0A4Z1SLW1_GIAMU|nr:IAD-5 dynein heavy chain [Giardia muris]|eukprot:TNJ26530.1 IAD-5 dynein heavy chain [Giardia muris]